MFQVIGSAVDTFGYVNITYTKGGKVGFRLEDNNGNFYLFYVKSVVEMPYNLSIIQISQAITSADVEAPTLGLGDFNLTSIMAKQGCKAFADLLRASKALSTYDGGLTMFCPIDNVVNDFLPKYKYLIDDQNMALFLYHGLPVYESMQMNTLATEGANKYDFTVQNHGEDVKLETKVVTATIA